MGGSGYGQGDDHAASLRLSGFGMDVAAVEIDDPARDGQAETGSAVADGTRGVGSVEALEDLLGLRWAEAGASTSVSRARVIGAS